jgi:hypothetical protein
MKLTRILAVAGLMAFSAVATAAPLTGAVAPADVAGQSLVTKVHDGNTHRDCQEGRRGWHRHDRYGERIECSPPRYGYDRPRNQYDGYRPPVRRCVKDWHCEKAGPFGIEKRCYWRDLCN